MNTTDADSNLVFYYEIDALFRRVSNRTIQRTRNLKDGAGRPVYDNIALTEDDRPTFNTIAPKAAVKVFQALQSLAVDVTDAYQYNANSPDGDPGYILFTLTPPTTWDPNTTTPLDTLIEDLLTLYMVKEWFRIAGAPEFAFEYETEFENTKGDLQTYAHRRTARTTRPYKIM